LIDNDGSHYMATNPHGLWRERHQFLVVSISWRSLTVPIAPKGKPRAAVPWAYPLRVLPRLGSRESHR